MSLLVLALLGCRGEAGPRPPAPEPEPTGDTGGGTPQPQPGWGVVDEVACLATENALRVRCTVRLSRPEAVRLVVEHDPPWVFASEGAAETHEISVWGLAPARSVAWRLEVADGGAEGVFNTGQLPGGLRAISAEITGSPSGAEALLFPYRCGQASGVALMDLKGVIRWYEPLEGDVQVVTWDGADGWAALVERSVVVRERFDGRRHFSAGGFQHPLHHDVFVDAVGRSWVLEAHLVGNTVVDGLYVLDPSGALIATWALEDHVPIGEIYGESRYWDVSFPLAADWSHGNAVFVDGDRGLLSLRWPHAVLSFVADPDAANFGAVRWALVGSPSEIPSDLALVDGSGFVGQHHPTWLPDGRLQLFDNGPAGAPARVLRFDVDALAGEARLSEQWSLGETCPVQGAAYAVADGAVVATCGPRASASWLEPGSAAATAAMALRCDGRPHALVPRFVPVPWRPGQSSQLGRISK